MMRLVVVWAGLLVLLGLTVGVSAMNVGVAAAEAAAMSISLAKTLLVLFFFMELRASRWAMRGVAVAAAVMFLLLLGGTLQDYRTRGADASPVAPPSPGVAAPSPDADPGAMERAAGFE